MIPIKHCEWVGPVGLLNLECHRRRIETPCQIVFLRDWNWSQYLTQGRVSCATPSGQRAGADQTTATDLTTVITLANELRAALVEKGLMKGGMRLLRKSTGTCVISPHSANGQGWIGLTY
jgi:hypothetical protein